MYGGIAHDTSSFGKAMLHQLEPRQSTIICAQGLVVLRCLILKENSELQYKTNKCPQERLGLHMAVI